MLASALDDDPEDMHPDAREFVAEVRKFGWMATHVYAGDATPSFTYTTGLSVLRNQPELIVFCLDMETAHGVLSNVVREADKRPSLPIGAPISGVLESGGIVLFPTTAAKHAEWLLRSVWFYGTDDFPCQQVVFPDRNGRFPWQDGVDPAFRDLQPDLTGTQWASNLRH